MIIDVLKSFMIEIFEECGYDMMPSVKKSNRPDLCDYQCDDIFKLANLIKKTPIEIGENIVNKIKSNSKYLDYFNNVEFVKPGFINFNISNKLINNILNNMFNNSLLIKNEIQENYFIDYGGPNIAKPLHVGHLRSAVVGESIKRIIKYMGHNVISDVHLGDYGLQIGQVIYGIIKDNKTDIDIDYLDYIYPYMSGLCKENEEVKEECTKITKELQDVNPYYQELWKKILEISKKDILKQYKFLDISFDIFDGESDAYPYIEELTSLLNKKKLLENSNGALVIDVKEESDKLELPPLIYQKTNGAYLYGTTDLATILKRVRNYKIDHMIYVADLRQNLHFEQVFRSAIKAEISVNTNYRFCGFGTVNGKDGKPYKTRSGNAPKLQDLFIEIEDIFTSSKESNQNMSREDKDIIINAIIKFADLQNNREKDYIFDIDKFSSVVGKTGPYILYTYLRINKLIENTNNKNLSANIYNETDRNLRLKVVELHISLNNALRDFMPSYIADYLYELCVCANSFYENNHIKNIEDQTKKDDFIILLNLTNKIIFELLDLLVIKVPSVM